MFYIYNVYLMCCLILWTSYPLNVFLLELVCPRGLLFPGHRDHYNHDLSPRDFLSPHLYSQNFICGPHCTIQGVQAFLNFHGFDFWDFRFNAVYNSVLFSSPLVLLSNLDLHNFCIGFFLCPHIDSVNRGMPVFTFHLVRFLAKNQLYSNETTKFCEAFADSSSKIGHDFF